MFVACRVRPVQISRPSRRSQFHIRRLCLLSFAKFYNGNSVENSSSESSCSALSGSPKNVPGPVSLRVTMRSYRACDDDDEK